jgi:hypothetical protein
MSLITSNSANYLTIPDGYAPPPVEADTEPMSAQECIETIKTWKNGKFNFEELKAEGESTSDPKLKKAIDQLLARPDWQYLLDGDKEKDVDGYVSKKDMNRFLDRVKQDESNYLIEGRNNFDNFKQGSARDCYFLGAIIALKGTEEGQKRLEQMIKPVAMEDGKPGYQVIFPGDVSQKVYTISHADAINNQGFSKGDLSTKVLEMAAEQYATDHPANLANLDTAIGKNSTIKEGGSVHDGLALLTGHQVDFAINEGGDHPSVAERFANEGLKDSKPFCVSVNISENGTLNHEAGLANHVITVTKVDYEAQTVSYINPWDSTKTENMPLNDFVANCYGMAIPRYDSDGPG